MYSNYNFLSFELITVQCLLYLFIIQNRSTWPELIGNRIIQKYKIANLYIFFDMLRQLGNLPPQAKGCFYDNLAGINYTCIDGQLFKCDKEVGDHAIPLALSRSSSYADPSQYLHSLVVMQGSAALNTQCTIATNKTNSACTIRSTRSISDRACWRWHVPNSLHGTQLGVCLLNTNGAIKYLPFVFNSSTARTVTFLVDNHTVKAWINDAPPAKNNCKDFQWDYASCYPYAKLTTKGSSIIFNPFAVQPNSKIAATNPFNSISCNKQQALKLNPLGSIEVGAAKIIDVKQLSNDKLLLVAEGGLVKLVQRNPITNKIQFDNIIMSEDSIYNLFTQGEWKDIMDICEKISLPKVQWRSNYFKVDEVLNLLKYLITVFDEQETIHNNPKYYQLKYLLLTKIIILRPYLHNKIPNSVSICAIDRQQHNYSQKWFNSPNSTPLRIIPQSVVTNSRPWLKLQGSIAAISQHYFCTINKIESQSKQSNLVLYHINNFGIKKCFTAKFAADKLDFVKASILQNTTDIETNLWKESTQSSQIYKILTNCFSTQGASDINAYQVKEKDINELVQVFKIQKQQAITSLEQTGNLEDALAWLADTNHKITRRKKNQIGKDNQNSQRQTKTNCSIIQLPKNYLTSQLLLQLFNNVYVIGFSPKTFARKYVEKTDKGFLSLSSLEYGSSLSEIKQLCCHEGLNLAQLSILDHITFSQQSENDKAQALFLFNENNKIYLTSKKSEKFFKTQLQFSQQNIYKQACSLKFNQKLQSFANFEGATQNQFITTINGQIYTVNQSPDISYKNNTLVYANGSLFTNISSIAKQELISTAQVWLKFKQAPTLTFSQSEQTNDSKFLPLLVQRGPPGCNMNYPICSILYPKAPLTFLANYPYALTFRHLHSKCMKVSEVIIQRIGEKHNVNQIKQGSVYFIDDANVQSKKYHFKFDTKNQLAVKIDEQSYWRYMIIEPTYNKGSKLPYEIGFMGAKGTSIELQEYTTAFANKIEQCIDVNDKIGRRRFELLKLDSLSHSTYKATLLLHTNDHKNIKFDERQQIDFKSKSDEMSIVMTSFKRGAQQVQNSQNKYKHQYDVRPNQLAFMTSAEIIAALLKPLSAIQNKKASQTIMILRQLGKNENLSFKDFNETQIKVLIDVFISNKDLSVKQFAHIYEKLKKQNQNGAKYLDQVVADIGKGYAVTIQPKYMPFILNIISSKEKLTVSQQILKDLVENARKIKNEHYNILQKQYNSSYLMLETDYYSNYYYEQVKLIEQGNLLTERCDKIYKESVIPNYKFVTIKQNKVRKLIIKFNEKCSIKNILLRFDKSDTHNKASINVYAWNGKSKSLCGQFLIYEHQWIQMTKNPYRKQMINMFSNNHAWLNGYGISLDNRVEASYIELQILFPLNTQESANEGSIQILPQVYGTTVSSADPSLQLQQAYFRYSEDERIFLSKLSLRLQIDSQSKNKENVNLFNKYLINKQNQSEYQIFEGIDNIGGDSKLQRDQEAIQFKTDIDSLVRITSQPSEGVMLKKHNQKNILPFLQRYHKIMRNLSDDGSTIRRSRKMNLDYCYTLIMWILEAQAKKQIVVSEKTAKLLLQEIVKKQVGPVSYACFKVISHYPDLLIDGLHYVQIHGENQKQLPKSVPSSILKGNLISINNANIKKVIESKDARLAQSLLNLIIDSIPPSQQSIHQCILLADLCHKNDKVISYLLRQPKQTNQQSKLFQQITKQKTYQQITKYIYSPSVSQQQRNEHFIAKLNSKELQGFILTARKLNNDQKLGLPVDFNYLLEKLLNDKKVHQINLDVVSLIFELNLPADEQWDFLQKCIKCCPTAEQMIHLQYLSVSREEKEQLLQLATFHRDILFSAAKYPKNSQLLVNFLGEIFYCNRKLFAEVVLSFPETEIAEFHSDINSIIFRLLQDQCNLGGIEGAKFATLQQNVWLATVVRLFKHANNQIDEKTYTNSEIEAIVKWYLLNNEYELQITNPINRSPAVNNMKYIVQRISAIISKVGGAQNINRLFEIHSQIKSEIKKDYKSLLSTKHLILNRLQFGVCKLMQNNLQPENLSQVLIGKSDKNGLIQQIVKQLQQEQKNQLKTKPNSLQKIQQQDLADELQVYSLQNGSLNNIPCKDVQSFKSGSKSHAFALPVSCKRLILKPTHNLNVSKFIIGFSVQDSTDKNIILPDHVQLYGGKMDDINGLISGTSTVKKICDLLLVQDQQYTQFGVKLFAINFDCIKRQYRNSEFNVLQIRAKSHTLPSTSDILQCNQKNHKNLIFNVSFIAINGHKQYTRTQLSFSDVYMKMLTFLSVPGYEKTMKQFIKYSQKNKDALKRLIQLLNTKAQKINGKDTQIQNLLIAFSRNQVPVIDTLLKKQQINYELVNKILKASLNANNLDLVLENTLSEKLNEQFVHNLIDLIKLYSLSSTTKSKKIKQKQILDICHRYKNAVKNQTHQQNKQQSSAQAKLLRKLLACITTSPTIYEFDPVKLCDELFKAENGTTYFPIIASFAPYYKSVLQNILNNKLDEISNNLVEQMSLYANNKNKDNQIEVSNLICLVSSLSIYPPIRQRFILNSKNLQINRLPIKVFNLLRNEQTLIHQYPSYILSKFINLFQTTCSISGQGQNSCAEQFAAKLIEVMTKLPQTPSAYHNYFIHHFFFPIINAYNGVLVSYIWRGANLQQYLTKPTEILQTLPIRKNDTVIQFNGKYYKQVTSTQQYAASTSHKLITHKNKVIAHKAQRSNDWGLVGHSQQQNHHVKLVQQNDKTIKLSLQNNQTKTIKFGQSQSAYSCYVYDAQIKNDLSRMLTNQTLLRMKQPTIFANNYTTNIPFALGMHIYTYLMPAEMTIGAMLKQVNICGYHLNHHTRDKIKLYQPHQKDAINHNQMFNTIFKEVCQTRPIVQIQVNAYDLFKYTTIQKIAKQHQPKQQSTKFIPQQTIFKSFEKLQGLQKMIKVIMACVKNWSNQNQSKIWAQYLNQLSSFSCFPIFSSIYMNKQQNVELLFSLLSGLPDKQDNTHWLKQQKKSVKSLYDIIKNVFQVQGQQAITIRNYAVQSGFYQTMLERLHLITKQPKRSKAEQAQDELDVPTEVIKKASEDEYKKQIKKKKGIGYGNDSSSNQKWDIAGHEEAKKQKSQQIVGLIKILQKFLSHPKFKLPSNYLQATYQSALLPILQASLRAGSLLQISKNAQLFKEQLKIIKVLSKNQVLIPTLMDIPKIYQPKQSQSIFSLLTTLQGTSKIFLSCLNKQVSQKTSEEIAKNIIDIYNQVQQAISNYKSQHVDENEDKKILQLPLAKKYPILLKDLRFDYIDMKDKNGKIKHHFSSNFQAKHTPPPTKAIRLAQELADISQALPIEHTNAIYVRCDKDRVDFMQALIMGSNGTPYGHGAYLFDIYFEDTYPNNPPKVNLTTTGSGSIRFNPNLYSCGKVCLSLLGTWRGTAMENWDPKVSTLLQVLVSIQSIIMAEEIYFNQPGFQHEQGTVEGEKKNEGYSNVVRYGNIKFAMIQNLKNPPKGFETVIRRHFYLKKDQILKQCSKWLKFAQKREAAYTGLVSDHNHNWANTFKKSKTQYQTMLEKAIKQLQAQLNKLPQPSAKDLIKQKPSKSPKKKQKKQTKVQKDENLQQIDVTYQVKPANGVTTNYKELDVNDEKVKDRWSRYIGAMGLQAVNKQSKANILLFGLSSLGIEIAKNIVLSGCKRFSVCDNQVATWKDLSGQFYLSQQQVNKNRVDSCLYKLQDLNNYVRVDSVNIDLAKLEQDNKLKQYQVVISTVHNEDQLIALNNYCRKNDIKFIAVKCEGPYGFIFNDFNKLQVLDKNGQQPVQCFIESITNEEQGVVTLMAGQKHPYEDGEFVKITNVKGMQSKEDQKVSINQTLHKISVINKSSFKIGNTTQYSQYQGNGLVKNIKVPIQITFKSFEDSLNSLNIDQNLAFYDFAKSVNNETLHRCFRALSAYKLKHQNKYPRPWNWEDAQELLELYKTVPKPNNGEQSEPTDAQKSYIYKFSFTCGGSFAPLAAFYGGLVAQQAFKAITNKYMPINQFFLTDFTEVIQQLPKEISEWKEFVENKKIYKPQETRFEGLKSIVGDQTMQKIRDCNVFVIGSGAIGCELLKNYAMINLATGEKPNKGTIVVTDPDHIQVSNLNRQFLFREKHLQKPKSATAAAVVKQMNKYLKGENKIRAKLIKVCQATKDTFSNEFFESMDIVTNALDNVQARQYVDMRCVESKVALLQSGTLSTKGHVQVIIPYKTQTYGSKADPAEQGDIPHCTLKMFPEQTLHCVQWARDIFGKTFTMKPKALAKIIQTIDQHTPTPSQVSVLKDCLHMLQQKPSNFDDAVVIATKEFYKLYRNDIKQLLYTYPLDAKTKDGKDFWKLPKRPPTPIQEINPQIKLHSQFITAYAVLLCKTYNIPYPKDFRTQERRKQITQQAAKIKIEPFMPSDKIAKQMATEVEQSKKQNNEMQQQEIKQKVVNQQNQDYVELFKNIKQMLKEEQTNGNAVKMHAQQFEKDDDSNGHIDLIYSMANLRAKNYCLEPMDWITTKLKAGRITPALSTTTSCIAALQTIELIKYLKKLPVDQMKNTFLNLAAPIIQAGEPGEIQKIKIHESLTTNLWERWTIDDINLNEITMGSLLKNIQQKFQVKVKTLSLLGGGPIYSDLVLGLESKKQQKQHFMQRKFKQIVVQQLGGEQPKNYVDLTLVMGVGGEFVKHVPTLRVNFKN